MEEKNYRALLSNIRNLTTIPSIMIEVSKMLENPLTSAFELGKIICKDQGLAAKILAVANSPLYGIPRKVCTIDFAIVVLGFENIKDIILALTLIDAFKGNDSKYWDKRSYWIHSFIVAGTCKRIAEELGYRNTTEAFTAGLLHDVGISVFQRYFLEKFNKMCEAVDNGEGDYLTQEVKTFGFTHQEVAFYLFDKWNLPETLGHAILNHHTPSRSEQKYLSSIIHLADHMTNKFNVGESLFDQHTVLDQEIIQILRLGNEEHLEHFIQKFEPTLKHQVELIKI
jgi:putative nucleotidyltransferase with HDIG domain